MSEEASGPETQEKRPRLPIRFRRKVVLYPVWRDRLLVFTEPDFPEVGVQVPGGTVAEGEAVEDGARREFLEETGFEAPATLVPLGEMTYVYEAGGYRHQHLRSYFLLQLEGDCPEHWEWTEETPDGGGGPIRMAFSFVPLTPVPILFGRLDAMFPALLSHLGIEAPAR